MLALIIGLSVTFLVGYYIVKSYAASGVLLVGGIVLLSVSAALGYRILPEEVVEEIQKGGSRSELMGTWRFGCPPDPTQWLAGLGWKADLVGTRASLAGALGLGQDVCAFSVDPDSPKNGRSLFIAATVA